MSTRRGWKKGLSTAVVMSLLASQQGPFVSDAVAGVVAAEPSRAVTPVTGVGTAGAVPIGSLGAAPSLSPTGSLAPLTPILPTTLPTVRAKAAAPTAAAAAPSAAIAAAAPTLALPAAAASAQAEDAQLLLPVAAAIPLAAAPQTVKTPPAGATSELHQLGGALAKGAQAPSLLNFFDGARRSANAVAEQAGDHLAASPAPAAAARNGLAPAPKESSAAEPAAAPAPEAKAPTARRKFIEFNVQYLKDLKKLFLESATKPNAQDYTYLATKTFGVNLAIRVAFAIKGVHAGQLGIMRAIVSTAWYQLQDAFFTVFGQTYMKFLGKMTGMLRIGNAKVGDLLFVYVQLVASEFLNRLVLGPIGENPLVYSWGGIGLLLLNNLQGMISGGLLVPVINKLRAAGLISEKTSNNLYQLASLTMHLGLLATFGYQSLFTWLTTILMIFSWGAYIGLSFFVKDKPGAEKKL